MLCLSELRGAIDVDTGEVKFIDVIVVEAETTGEERGDEGVPVDVDDVEETGFEAVDGVEVDVPGVLSTDGGAVEDTWVGERAEASADRILESTEPKPPSVVAAPAMTAVVVVSVDASLILKSLD